MPGAHAALPALSEDADSHVWSRKSARASVHVDVAASVGSGGAQIIWESPHAASQSSLSAERCQCRPVPPQRLSAGGGEAGGGAGGEGGGACWQGQKRTWEGMEIVQLNRSSE